MDKDSKKPSFWVPRVGKGNKGGSRTPTIPPEENASLQIARMNSSDADGYDGAFAASIAAVAYAIAAQEEKLAAQKKPIPIDGQPTAPPLQPAIKRGESMKKATGGSKISRWFSGKEPVDEDEGPANVSVRRKDTISDQMVPPKKGSGSSGKLQDKKGSKKFDQEQVTQKAPSTVRPATSYHSRRNGDGTIGVTAVGAADTKTDEWEKAKLTSIREEYQKMIDTIAEWENEKKKELDRKRAKALEEYNQEITRINKIAGGARSMAEERKYNDEKKIKEKANKRRSTEKAPRTCACF
ncbi:remorin 1.4-like isoform X2 [Oryza brachyantha]|uniref:remorin 1.4-like isoform X2 n=1 Tax=Oryza brachyantha TaxID=4533 RepID=UPI0007768E86|nr:remorin 1.4-like isoform X2 [Oryza brachyantha]